MNGDDGLATVLPAAQPKPAAKPQFHAALQSLREDNSPITKPRRSILDTLTREHHHIIRRAYRKVETPNCFIAGCLEGVAAENSARATRRQSRLRQMKSNRDG